MAKYIKSAVCLCLSLTLIPSLLGINYSGYVSDESASAPRYGDGGPVVTSVSSVEEAQKLFADEDGVTACAAAKDACGGCLTACHGECAYYPGIIVPGNTQSRVYQLDENGNRKLDENGNALTTWPMSLDTDAAVNAVAGPLAMSILTQSDSGLTEAVGNTLDNLLAPYAIGDDAMPVNVEVEKYPFSVAMCNADQKNFIYSCTPVQPFSKVAGEDHLYFLAYNSTGNLLTAVDDLYNLIQRAKTETGHDKVNMIAISLGGSVFNALIEFYPQVKNDLHRIALVVPGYDGTSLLGDIFINNLSYEDDMLYRDMIPSFFDTGIISGVPGYVGYLANLMIRMLPEDVLRAVLDVAYQKLTGALTRSTAMWSLVPSSYYEEASAIWLNRLGYEEIKRQADLYRDAQLDAAENILSFVSSGVQIFDIVNYDVTLFSVVRSYTQYNSDGILPLYAASMGATCGYVNTPLPDGYVQQNTHCTDPTHNHMSPDGIVDASTGLLPDQTWYFRYQRHENTAGDDVIIRLLTALALSDDITSVYSDPRFPQFNTGRISWPLQSDIDYAGTVDRSTLTPEDAAELDAAVAQAQAVLDNTIVDTAAYDAAKTRLYAILVKIGAREAPEDTTVSDLTTFVLELANETLYTYLGGCGYSDAVRNLIS